jgi:cell wall assembly regulator SMI1
LPTVDDDRYRGRMPGPKTNPLSSTLAKIDDALARTAPDVHKTLKKGARPAKLSLLRKAMSVPDDAVDLFAWHDGQRGARQLHPEDNRTLLSVDEALDAWRFLCDPANEIMKPWSKTWLPLLTNGAGDYVCIETGTKRRGALITYYHDDKTRPSEYASVTAWAEALLGALTKEAAKRGTKKSARVELDASHTTWKKRAKAPTAKELAKLPIGAAFSWTRSIPMGVRTWVYVKLAPLESKEWRYAMHVDAPNALARLQEKLNRPRPPEDYEWKADSDDVADEARTPYDLGADKPKPVQVLEGTIAVQSK